MTAWFRTPDILDEGAWREAVREVAELCGDEEALGWVEERERFFELLGRGGVLVGAPEPTYEERARAYAELDVFLGIREELQVDLVPDGELELFTDHR